MKDICVECDQIHRKLQIGSNFTKEIHMLTITGYKICQNYSNLEHM